MECYEPEEKASDGIPSGVNSRGFQSLETENANCKEQGLASNQNQEMTTSQMNLSIPSEFSPNEPLAFWSVPLEQQSRYTRISASSTSKVSSSFYPQGPIVPYSITPQNLELEAPSYLKTTSVRSSSNHNMLNNQRFQNHVFTPSTRSSLSMPTHTYQSDPCNPSGKAESSEVVWCKVSLKALPDSLSQGAPCSVNAENQIQEKSTLFQTGNGALTSKMKIPRYVFHPNEALRPQQQFVNPFNKSFSPGELFNYTGTQRSDASAEDESSDGVMRSDNQKEHSRLQEFQNAMRWKENCAALCLNQMAQSINKNTAFNNPLRYVSMSESQGQERKDNDLTQAVNSNLHQVLPPHFPASNGYRQSFLPTLDQCGAQASGGSNSNAAYSSALNDFTFQRANQGGIFHQNTILSQLNTGAPAVTPRPVGAPTFAPYPISIPPSAPFSPILKAMGPVYAGEDSRERTNEEAILHPSFSTTIQRKPTPAGYALDHMPLLAFPRGLGYQAPVPFGPRRIPVLQYPDPRTMFREANLLILDQANEGRAAPVETEESSATQPPATQEETSPSCETPFQKEENSAKVSPKRIHQSHQCNICSKVCARASSLKVHIRTHTGEKPFSCKVCQRTFAQAGGLKSHMRSHTGERPYQCDVCNRLFTHSTAVVNHKRTHTGEKPFACYHKGCGKKFADQSTLKKHKRIHTGEKPFQCPHCTRKFTQLGNMNKHLRCKHSDKKKGAVSL